jgi:hypothetical protein
MNDITIRYPYRINPRRLSAELHDALGDTFAGVVTRPNTVRVILVAPPTDDQRRRVHGILRDHDANADAPPPPQTPLDQLRSLPPIDVGDAAPDALRTLAERLALVEAVLRGRR